MIETKNKPYTNHPYFDFSGEFEYDSANTNIEDYVVCGELEFTNEIIDFHCDILPFFQDMDSFIYLEKGKYHIYFHGKIAAWINKCFDYSEQEVDIFITNYSIRKREHQND